MTETDIQTAADSLTSPRLEAGFGVLARIEETIIPLLEDLGFSLVRASMIGGSRQKLQIMIERTDGCVLSVEDCAIASRNISALLDVEDPIAEAYALEVSSPGIDRPLTRPVDFERYRGMEIKLETRTSYDNRRRFRGVLDGYEDGEVRMIMDGEHFGFRFDDLVKAKLVMTDELVRWAQSGLMPGSLNPSADAAEATNELNA